MSDGADRPVSTKTKAKWVSRDLKRGVAVGGAGLVGGYLIRKAKERREKKQRIEKLRKALGGRKLVLLAVGNPSSQEKKAAFFRGVQGELAKLAVKYPTAPEPPKVKPPAPVPKPPTVRAVKMPGLS